jgi:hypothetical protein
MISPKASSLAPHLLLINTKAQHPKVEEDRVYGIPLLIDIQKKLAMEKPEPAAVATEMSGKGLNPPFLGK